MDFLRFLYRTAHITAGELDDRLAALAALQHGEPPSATSEPAPAADTAPAPADTPPAAPPVL